MPTEGYEIIELVKNEKYEEALSYFKKAVKLRGDLTDNYWFNATLYRLGRN